MPTTTRPAAGLPNWTVEVNADAGPESISLVRVIARSSGAARLTGAGVAAMVSALSTYYGGGKAATMLQNNRDGSLLCSVTRDQVLITAANVQIG